MDWTFTIGNLSFGIFDIILVAVCLISGISGFAAGFSRFVFKAAGYVLTFPLALLFVLPMRDFLSKWINIPVIWLSLVSYIILCLVTFTLFKVLGNLLGTSMDTLHLGWIDSVLGLIFAIAIALIVLFALLEVASLQTFVSLIPLKENSFFYTHVYLPLFPTIVSTFKGALLGL